ncbi:MAG TPA: hypothetical protein DDY49_06900 [Paenibacillaceae bacterium]|nr:hypothetical protein [Paenibacillaceae bacterium]
MRAQAKVFPGVSPELQSEFVEMLPVLVRTLNLIKLVGDTMSEETIAHTMSKLEKASNLLTVVEDERLPKLLDVLIEKSDVLVSLLDKVGVLEKNGSLDKLLELGQAIGIVTDSLTENSIKHMTETALPLLEMGDQLLSSSLVKSTPKLVSAVEKTVQDIENEEPTQLSMLKILGLLKKQEVQQAMHFGVTLLGNLSKSNTK